jgi:hypothetical protein
MMRDDQELDTIVHVVQKAIECANMWKQIDAAMGVSSSTDDSTSQCSAAAIPSTAATFDEILPAQAALWTAYDTVMHALRMSYDYDIVKYLDVLLLGQPEDKYEGESTTLFRPSIVSEISTDTDLDDPEITYQQSVLRLGQDNLTTHSEQQTAKGGDLLVDLFGISNWLGMNLESPQV